MSVEDVMYINLNKKNNLNEQIWVYYYIMHVITN